MTPRKMFRRASTLALIAGAAIAGGVMSATAVTPTVVYDATPSPLPPNVVSLGYQATSTTEFGDAIQLAGTNRELASVTVTMSAWGRHAEYPAMDSAGWSHPITVNIYATTLTSGVPNTLLASVTKNVAIPWRPAADPTCPGGTAWRATDGNCYNGFAFNAVFDMSSLGVTLPNEVIVGVEYSTQTYGDAPIGVPGPYNSLNVGLVALPTTGVDILPDGVYWDTSFAGFYADGGTAGVGIFRQDTDWTGYTPAIQVTATEPLVARPANANACKKDGWKTFNNPSFKNQGQCIQFVNTGK